MTTTRKFFTNAPKAFDYRWTFEASANTSYSLYPGRIVSGRDVAITGTDSDIAYQTARYESGLYIVKEL